MPTGKGLTQTVLLNKGLNSPGLVWTWSIVEATTKRKKEKASPHNKHRRKENKPTIP